MIKTVIVIEDNKDIVDYIKDFLTLNGEFKVKGYLSGSEAILNLKKEKPDLVLLDLKLGDVDGEYMCKEIRKLYATLPIIILTADVTHTSIINCLNAGADDYITKPFDSEELLARIRVRLRTAEPLSNQAILSLQDLTLNTETLETFRGKQKIDLTAKEFELLKYLLVNKERVSTRDKILYSVWDYASDVDTRVVDVHIGKLRKKLEENTNKKYIEAVRGYGYKLIQ